MTGGHRSSARGPRVRGEFAEERRDRIADLVATRGRVTLAELVTSLGVSEQTVRKDLDLMQDENLLRRTHGGAIAVNLRQELTVDARARRNRAAKQAIARTCTGLVVPRQSIFLDAGTTISAVAAALDIDGVNVLTNSPAVAGILADRPGVRHTLLGGQLRATGGSLVGPLALENLARFVVDIAFIGATGVTAEAVTVADIDEAQVKQVAMTQARQVVVAVDSSKFGATDFAYVSGLDRIDVLVTDHAPREVRKWGAANSVRIHESH